MKYEKPKLETMLFEVDDIIRTSDVEEVFGDNNTGWTPDAP